MRKRIIRKSKTSSVEELMQGLVDITAGEDVKYLQMTDSELITLPSFDENGNVCMYEVGGVLLGKGALLRWVDCHKVK